MSSAWADQGCLAEYPSHCNAHRVAVKAQGLRTVDCAEQARATLGDLTVRSSYQTMTEHKFATKGGQDGCDGKEAK